MNSITEENNEGLTAKVDELICMIKGNETQVNAITDAKIEEIDFVARNSFDPAWSQNYGSTFQKTIS